MSKYLATDLDGTLMHPKLKTKYVCKENKETIKDFNGKVIIVSGRNQKFVKNVCKEIGIKETFISCNGASIYLNGEEIYTSFIKTKIINEIIIYVKNNFDTYKIILFDKDSNLYSLSNNNKKVDIEEREWKKDYPKLAYITNKNIKKINELLSRDNTIIKLNIVLDEKDKFKLYNYLKDKGYQLSYALCKHSLELTSAGVNKGTSLIRLTKAMKLNKNDLFVVGDDKNDISMFKEYKNSFLINHQDNNDLDNEVLHILNKFKDLKNYIKED